MSLPDPFSSPEEYFQESMAFLRAHQHLYNFANTKLLSTDCFERISLEGLEGIDLLDEEVTLVVLAERSGQMKEFLERTERLTFNYDEIGPNGKDLVVDSPLSLKKRHEILHLAQEIREACEEADCVTVVDFGSGLGYLDQLIYSKHNYNVLGLEASKQNYTSAKTRQRKYHPDSVEKVKYIRHMIDGSSHEDIDRFLNDKFGSNGKFCITGLHACADLTIDALNIFLKMAAARSIVLMSCCYHKMALETCKPERGFKNFPLSGCFKDIWMKNHGSECIKVPFLRLAAQPPNVKEELKDLVFNLLARAVIQLYADKYDLKLTRRKRKAVKTKTIENYFESYIKQVNDGFRLTCDNNPCNSKNKDGSKPGEANTCECTLEFNFEELRQLWGNFSKDAILKKAAIFVLLQRRLQPVFENLILFDRITYLKENGLENCRMKKIFDDTISPRCFALVAIK